MIGDDVTAALDELRAQAESLMTETVQVSRVGALTDDGNGRQVPSTTTVYSGIAGLGKAGTQPASVGAPGQQAILQAQVVKFPISPYVPRDGDAVEFTAGTLTGVKMRLVGASPVTSQAVQYRMAAERTV
jgi:hypothetical protein